MAAGFSVKDALNKNSKAGIDESPRARFRTKDISIFKMYRNDMNFYSVEQVEELAGDILMYGLKQNLELVYAPCDKGEYRIVAGERRWEALKYLVSKGYKEFELATSKLTTPQDNDEEQVEIIIANAYRTKTTSDMIEEETRLKASNYDPAQITIACEADCSSGVAAIVKGAGYRLGNEKMKNVSIYLYTGNMRAGLKAAGFEVLTDSKYLTSDAYLLEGDILLNDNAHVATNLTDGAKSSGTGASNTTPVKSNTKVDVAHGFNKSLAGTYKVTASGLNLRAGAGTGKSILAVMKNGEKVQCYGYYNDCNGVKWLYVVYKNIVGYASSKYLSK